MLMGISLVHFSLSPRALGAGDLGSRQRKGSTGSAKTQGDVLGGPRDLWPHLLPTTQSGHGLSTRDAEARWPGFGS